MTLRQKGFSLIEMIVVIALTSLVSVWAASSWIQQAEDAASGSMAQWLLSVKGAVDQMLVRQADVMTGIGPGVEGGGRFGDLWRPSITELKRAGHLPSSFIERAPLGYDVMIYIIRPSGPCLTVGCKVEALTIASPKVDGIQDAQSTSRVGKILEAMPGIGASVTQWSPRRIVGSRLDMANPPFSDLPALPTGSIVLHSFHDTSAQTGFLRQHDRRHAQLGAGLSVAGKISAAHVQAENMQATQMQATQMQATQMQATHMNANHLQAGHLKTNHLEAGQLQVSAVADVGTPCSASGLIAQSRRSGLLVCQGGVWRSSARMRGGQFIQRPYFSFFPMFGLTRGPFGLPISDFVCPSGYRGMLFTTLERPQEGEDALSDKESDIFLCLSN